MVEIIDSRDKWPFPLPPTCRAKGGHGADGASGDDWVEVSEAVADEMRDCVPPIPAPHGFYVGEAADTDLSTGCPIYTLVVKAGGRWFMRDCHYLRDHREHHYLQLLQALHPAAAPEGSAA